MFKQIWHKIQSYGRSSKGESLREASKSLDIPKSTIWHQEKRNEERSAEMGTDYWNTAKSQYDLKRMIREDQENKLPQVKQLFFGCISKCRIFIFVK